MQLVMLSGNSLRNRNWIYEVRKQFREVFDDYYIQDYQHWHSGEEWINLDLELELLEKAAANFQADYGIFAKSIGTVLAAKALKTDIISPKFLLLVGLPMGYIREKYPGFGQVVFDGRTAVSVIQNEFDPVGSAESARLYMADKFSERGDYQFIEAPGDSHDYTNYELMRAELKRLKVLTT